MSIAYKSECGVRPMKWMDGWMTDSMACNKIIKLISEIIPNNGISQTFFVLFPSSVEIGGNGMEY